MGNRGIEGRQAISEASQELQEGEGNLSRRPECTGTTIRLVHIQEVQRNLLRCSIHGHKRHREAQGGVHVGENLTPPLVEMRGTDEEPPKSCVEPIRRLKNKAARSGIHPKAMATKATLWRVFRIFPCLLFQRGVYRTKKNNASLMLLNREKMGGTRQRTPRTKAQAGSAWPSDTEKKDCKSHGRHAGR